MSKLLLVAVAVSVLLPTLQAASLAALNNFFANRFLSALNPEETAQLRAEVNKLDAKDPRALYEELKEILKKVHPQLEQKIEEEEKKFTEARAGLKTDDAKKFVDEVAVKYLEVGINSFKGQLPSQEDIYRIAGELVADYNKLSKEAQDDLLNSAFFKTLVEGLKLAVKH